MDPVMLVTGASSGIGRAVALRAATAGWRVFAAARDTAALDALAAEGPGHIEALPMDVRDPAAVDSAMGRLGHQTGGEGVEALVNCAGYAQPGPLELLDDGALHNQFETNVFGLLRVTRALIPAMRRRKSGSIVLMGSIAGRFCVPNLGAYHATKYALEAVCDSLRMELRPFGIHVVLVEAGIVRTKLDERAFEAQKPYAALDSPYAPFLARTAALMEDSRRIACEPEDVARVVMRAITARRPADRYLVPAHARIAILLRRLLPGALFDSLVCRLLGFPRELEG